MSVRAISHDPPIAVDGDGDRVDVEVELLGARWLGTFVAASRVAEAVGRRGSCLLSQAVVVPAVSDHVIRDTVRRLIQDDCLTTMFAFVPVSEDDDEPARLPSAVVIRCDYTASPLWGAESGHNVPLEQFPLSAQLRDGLEAWARRWDAMAFAAFDGEREDEDDAPGQTGSPTKPRACWLWRRVHGELGNDLEIGFRRSFGVRLGEREIACDPARLAEP